MIRQETLNIEKKVCKKHTVSFERRTIGFIEVICPKYKDCEADAVRRHEENIEEARCEAEKKGEKILKVKAVTQIVCPYERPAKTVPRLEIRDS